MDLKKIAEDSMKTLRMDEIHDEIYQQIDGYAVQDWVNVDGATEEVYVNMVESVESGDTDGEWPDPESYVENYIEGVKFDRETR